VLQAAAAVLEVEAVGAVEEACFNFLMFSILLISHAVHSAHVNQAEGIVEDALGGVEVVLVDEGEHEVLFFVR
jgi:hypothetical protein